MTLEQIQQKYEYLSPLLDERQRRVWAAAEAHVLGRGGISLVSRATGMSRTTIAAGVRELGKPTVDGEYDVRRSGAGRPSVVDRDPELPGVLQDMVEATTRGDPESALRWTCKSTRKLSAELKQQGHPASPQKVGQLLRESGYSLQANRKTQEGTSHPDRDAQFHHINRKVKEFQRQGQPVISVDTKKKELVGNYKNGGREWLPQGHPNEVQTHDFPDPKLGKAIPYGVYDMTANEGWVNVGIDHDTPFFAVASIRRWWFRMGRALYPEAKELLITADAGGSNGYRARAWKVALQELTDRTGLKVTVCHFPPGTSKWNKIEHRMFCHITENWRGQPLTSVDVIVNLISNTTTTAGLRIKAGLDKKQYQTGVKISDEELELVNIHRSRFHGDWNYSIAPSKREHRVGSGNF